MPDMPQRKTEFMLPDMDSTFRVFAVHWRTVDPDWKYPLHHHPLFEVNLVLTGFQEMIVNGKRFEQRPGDLMLLRPGDQHESRVSGNEEMTYYCLHFDVDERSFRELLYRNKQCLYLADSRLAASIRPALDKLLALTTEEAVVSVESRMSVLSALFELFAGISGSLSAQTVDGAASTMSITASQVASMLENVVDQLAEGNRSDNDMTTIASIAAKLGYSPSAVNRMFTRAFGVSPRQYLSSLMLKKSKLLLMNPELSIEQIAHQLGYHNIAHFSRQFKRWSGESPSSFRRRFHA